MIKIIYTAQYRYGGADRLDITVKGKDPIGNVFAPTWTMVSDYMKAKKDAIRLNDPSILVRAERVYVDKYIHMMKISVRTHHQIWLDVIHRPEVTFVCFCPAGEFCHRYTLKDIFVSFGCTYGGER